MRQMSELFTGSTTLKLVNRRGSTALWFEHWPGNRKVPGSESLTRACPNRFHLFLYAPYKGLLSINNILCACHFFLFLSFLSHTFSWACGSLCEPQKFFQTFFLCIHFFVK